MKKLLCVTIALLCTATMQAQEEEKDVTKFLGIPVDGYKPAMIEKLKAKGFVIYPGKISQADTFRIGNIGDVHPEDFRQLIEIIRECKY